MTNKPHNDPLKKYYNLLSRSDEDFLKYYMRAINSVWKEYLNDRKHGSFHKMSMSKREEILKAYRDRLHEINIKHKKG